MDDHASRAGRWLGEDYDPGSGRILLVGPDHTFADLHEATETAFARWDRSHLHQFTLADGRRVGLPDPDQDQPGHAPHEERTLTPAGALTKGEPFHDLFDFGDCCKPTTAASTPSTSTLVALPGSSPATSSRYGGAAAGSVRSALGRRRRRAGPAARPGGRHVAFRTAAVEAHSLGDRTGGDHPAAAHPAPNRQRGDRQARDRSATGRLVHPGEHPPWWSSPTRPPGWPRSPTKPARGGRASSPPRRRGVVSVPLPFRHQVLLDRHGHTFAW